MRVYSFAINKYDLSFTNRFPKFKHEFLNNITDILAVEDKTLAGKFLEIGFTDQIIPRDVDESKSYIKILTEKEADELITDWQRYSKKYPEALSNYDLYKL